jgi:beta-lactam-binding protein with PASTA domain
VTASQRGSDTFDVAPDVARSFAIAPPPCKVPKVVGKKLAAAKATLVKRGCRTGKVVRAYSQRTPQGRVVSQSRKAGRALRAHARVDLVLSRGPRH